MQEERSWVKPLGYLALTKDNIYKHRNIFVTSLCFEQETELGEGDCAKNISQYPLEDILDYFCVYVSDFYNKLNVADSKVCYLEFASPDIKDIQRLRSIIGKHVYLLNGTKLIIE